MAVPSPRPSRERQRRVAEELERVGLPAEAALRRLPVLIVQHMPPVFTKLLPSVVDEELARIEEAQS